MIPKDTRIFLSCHTDDKNEAMQIKELLNADGWWNITMLAEESKAEEAEIGKIRGEDVFIPVLSRSYAMDAHLVLNEFSYAATVVYATCHPIWKESIKEIQEAVEDKELLSVLEMMTARYLNNSQVTLPGEAVETLKKTIPHTPSRQFPPPSPQDKPCSAYTRQNNPAEKDKYLFISYAHNDAAVVYDVIREIYEAGWDLWYDQGIKPTKQYLPTISGNLRNCSVFVLMLTDVCVHRPFVMDYELEYAKWLGLPIITVRLKGTPPWTEEWIERDALLQRIEIEAQKIGFLKKDTRKAVSPSLLNNVIYDIPMPRVPGFAFSINGDKLILDQYIGQESKVCVPGKVTTDDGKEYNVVIGRRAFSLSDLNSKRISDSALFDPIRSVVIEEGVTSIEDFAFKDCLNLTDITIPVSVTHIGEEAFSNCINLKSVSIPPKVESIGRKAFSQCKGLEQVTIPASVKKLGWSVFEQCYNLRNVVIEEGITSIPENMFRNCAFEDIVIPESVTEIGINAFANCQKLRRIDLPKHVKTIGSQAFQDCGRLEHIVIPDGVEKIDFDTFRNCSSLESVAIPESVSRIEARAFENCFKLVNINITKNIIYIGEYAFRNCKALAIENIDDLHESLYVAPNAFQGAATNILFSSGIEWDDISDVLDEHQDGIEALLELRGRKEQTPATAKTYSGALPQCDDGPRALVILADEDMSFKITEKQMVADFVTELYWEGYNVHYEDILNNRAMDCEYILAFLTRKTMESQIILGVLEKAIKRDPSKVILVVLEKGVSLPGDLNAATRGHQAIMKMNNTDAGLVAEIRRILKDEEFKCHTERPRGFVITETVLYEDKISILKSFKPTGFQKVIIPQSFTESPMRLRVIGAWSFSDGCEFIDSIIIPEGVIEIESFAFVGCHSLGSIVIPKSVNKIGQVAIGKWTVIYAYEGSAAAQYAIDNGISYKILY
jgi:hypothetical protein